MLKVAFDHQAFVMQKYGGISRYFYEVASRLARGNEFNVKIYAGIHKNKYLENISNDVIEGRQISYPSKLSRLVVPINSSINLYLNRLAVAKYSPDILHETYYSHESIASNSAKTVVTVYDMIAEKFSNSTANQEDLLKKERAIKRADHIICISNHTRSDLLDLFDLPPEKISVIYLGCSLQNFDETDAIPVITDPYILYVGDWRLSYKNFNGLLKAYGSKKQFQTTFKLVCIGSRAVSKDVLEAMKLAGVNPENVVYLSGNDLMLANLYKNALAFVYPSLYEGFGIPPLEAMSYGCPVICSNVSSIPEVVSDAGYYFDPNDSDSISDAIEKVLSSSELRQSLIVKGTERTKFFSWEKCAAQTGAVYRQLISV
jgi:glycosyltransferase involved in cell wall biosynthesis